MNKLILIIALALVSTGAWGYTSQGAGTDGCGKYVAEKQKNSITHYKEIAWVQGFITGGNSERERNGGDSQIAKEVGAESIALWLENYCQENPLRSLTEATEALVEELKTRE